MAKGSRTTMGNNALRCLNCGNEQPIAFPISISVLAAMAKAYDKEHARCKPSEKGRARFEYATPTEWLASWDTGASSLEIFHLMTGGIYGTSASSVGATPQDPDDFGRCHRLLKAFPQWRARMPDMVRVLMWAPLVARWDELERLFEEESPSGSCPKLYAALRGIEERP